jgi:hypothetical protein
MGSGTTPLGAMVGIIVSELERERGKYEEGKGLPRQAPGFREGCHRGLTDCIHLVKLEASNIKQAYPAFAEAMFLRRVYRYLIRKLREKRGRLRMGPGYREGVITAHDEAISILEGKYETYSIIDRTLVKCGLPPGTNTADYLIGTCKTNKEREIS